MVVFSAFFRTGRCVVCTWIRQKSHCPQTLMPESQINAVCRALCHTVRLLNHQNGNSASVEMTRDAIDTMIRSDEETTSINQGAIHSYEVNQLGANSPCEDHHSEGKCLATGGYLFGIFDGHAGGSCSRAVCRRLHDYICASLLPTQILTDIVYGKVGFGELFHWITCSAGIDLSAVFAEKHKENVLRFVERCLARPDLRATVRKSLQAAFECFDSDICAEALPDSRGKISVPHVAVAAAGSCALVGHLRGPHLHIANVGDSCAVLAVCNESGSWTARRLNQEHCIDNPLEVKRIRSEHPTKESSAVLKGGRLLGELFPLRAFGDVRYKWTSELQNVVLQPVFGRINLPNGFQSPPYLTATPEVFYHRLTPNDRFLILASDGLWEMLTPEKVVRLISDHMVGRQTLSPYHCEGKVSVDEILADLRLRKQGESKKPIDMNSATHVIRHALGGDKVHTQYYHLNTMLTLPPDLARNYRDDITVTIIYFDPNYLLSLNG